MLIDGAAITRLSLLKAIRRRGPISRVELAHLLGLLKGTVSEVTAELIASGMVSEEVSTVREKGRPRVLLAIQSDSFFVVGVSLDYQGFLELSLVDLSGNLIASERVPMGKQAAVTGIVRRIADVVDSFVDSAPVGRAQIASVAVAIPGVIETAAGLLHWLTTFPEEAIPAAKIIADLVGLPVIIENDIDCLARAEHWFGKGPDASDFTIVYQGDAVGLAQYNDGLPRTGLAGVNSEFGHVKTDFGDQARPCFCGARGCLTRYSSFWGIIVSRAADRCGPAPQIKEVEDMTPALLEAAVTGEPGAVAAFRTAGHHLGLALANYINTFDPRLVLIRTADRRMPGLIRQDLEAALAGNTIPTLLGRTTIEIDEALPDWRWKGTAALALEQAYLGRAVKKKQRAIKATAGV